MHFLTERICNDVGLMVINVEHISSRKFTKEFSSGYEMRLTILPCVVCNRTIELRFKTIFKIVRVLQNFKSDLDFLQITVGIFSCNTKTL